MIFNPVVNDSESSTPIEIEEFSVTISGTAKGNIQVFDQYEQKWKTPTDAPMNVVIGENLLIKTEVDLMNFPLVKQGSLSLHSNAAKQPLGINSFGWYFPDTSGYYGKSISINANAD